MSLKKKRRVTVKKTSNVVSRSGYSLLEVIIAIFIFSCVVASLFRAIGAADQIRGRALQLKLATALIQNEIETMHAYQDKITILPTDSSFTLNKDGRDLIFSRHVINTTEKASSVMAELDLSVKNTETGPPILHVRMLQPYGDK